MDDARTKLHVSPERDGGKAPRGPAAVGAKAARAEFRQLKVLIDGRKLWDGGIGVYTENLIAGLVEQPGVTLGVIVPSAVRHSARFSRYSWKDRVDIIEDNAAPYSWDEMFRLPRRIPFAAFDLYHVPHYTLPFGVPIPAVITVHDLIHIRYPEKFYYPSIAKRLIKSAIKRSARVLTVSHATLAELQGFCRRTGENAAKLRVVPNALDPYFLKSCDPGEYLSARFRLRRPYLLGVFSNLKPHKGLSDLLRAFHDLKVAADRSANELKLVLVGQGLQSSAEINRLLEHTGFVDDVYLFGAVSKEDLLNLYSGAAGLVVPSLAEGFGLPVIEAQACGTRVVARPVPALRELLTERDVLCGDFSLAALRRGLSELLAKPACAADVPASDWDLRLRRFDRQEIGKTVLCVYGEAIAAAGRVIERTSLGKGLEVQTWAGSAPGFADAAPRQGKE